MAFQTRALAVATTVFFFAAMQLALADAPSIKVKLWQKDGKGGIALSQNKMEEGSVEFVVTNTSTDPILGQMHEFLIFPWKGSMTSLPYDAKSQTVNEDKLPPFQGLEDMLPSATSTVRLVLKPGKYVIVSNQLPNDYKSGMVAEFTVLTPEAWDRLNQSGGPKH